MIRALRPADVEAPPVVEDPSILEAYLEDASGAPPGVAAGLVRPRSEAEAAAFLRQTRERGVKVIPQAARSSLTGGAIPRGEVILSVERLDEIGTLHAAGQGAWLTAAAGVRLSDLQAALAAAGYYYPPVPTYQQAMLGGTASTNAGGAATFKYGVTRRWIRGLRLLLHNGDLLAIERGEATARRGEFFSIGLSDGDELRVPVPSYRTPPLKKISAGYFSSDPLDLVDLVVGSEGTLGLITAVTVDVVRRPPAVVTGLVPLPEAAGALRLAEAMRRSAEKARHAADPLGPDVRAIEWLDPGSLEILRRHGDARRLRIRLPRSARTALLFELELAEPAGDAEVQEALAGVMDPGLSGPDGPLRRLLLLLREHAALEDLELAFPEDARRHRALTELREAVPQRVGEMQAGRRRDDPGVEKVGGDLIVAPEHLPEMIEIFRDGFERRGLPFAIWGHLADGNLHPNALASSGEQVRLGFDALLEFGGEAARRGGCPLSEHGVGRHPIKQELLRRFLGEDAISEMRRVKRAFDPEGRFAPGVLFPPG